jgi:hypothetical protein
MKILKSENTLNLGTQVALPTGIIKGLYIRFVGVGATGVTVTEAQLGTIRVNYRGNDIVNADLAGIGLFNNLHKGTHEFAAASGGAVTASYYIPFCLPWDENNGLINTDADRGTVYLSFPALAAAVMASGSVEVYVIEARTVAQYVPVFLNQSLQSGGAGTLTDRFRQFNISSIYIVENVHITGTIIVNRDGQNIVNASQAVLKAASNLNNRVETAVALIQLDLNPNQLLAGSLSNNVEVNLGMDAATTVVCYVLGVLFQQSAVGSGVGAYSGAGGSGALNSSTLTTQPVKVGIGVGASS